MLVIPVIDLRKSVAKIEGPGVISIDSSIRRLDNTQARVRETSPEPVPKERTKETPRRSCFSLT